MRCNKPIKRGGYHLAKPSRPALSRPLADAKALMIDYQIRIPSAVHLYDARIAGLNLFDGQWRILKSGGRPK
jgi:hypothetical protein